MQYIDLCEVGEEGGLHAFNFDLWEVSAGVDGTNDLPLELHVNELILFDVHSVSLILLSHGHKSLLL